MIDYLRKKLFIPLQDKREGNTRLRYLPIIKSELYSDEKIIKERQLARLKDIISYAYNKVPFYRNLYNSQGSFNKNMIQSDEDITRLPTISKEDIRIYNNEFLSNEYKPDDLIITGTGGTTSSPVTLKYTRDCFSQKQACTLFFFQWFNCNLGDKSAYIWGAEQDFPKRMGIKQRIVRYLVHNVLMLPSNYLNDSVMMEYYWKLKKFKPRMLQAYTTPLYIFSDFLERYKLYLDIPSINVSAEYLFDYQREKIEQVFGCKIFNWYGAREIGHAATECKVHKGMHINTYGLFFEVIKDDRRVYDEMGEIVVTDLLNKAMPLIRYKIGDLGILTTRKCTCGSSLPLLEDIGGRYVDSFKCRDGSIIPSVGLTCRIARDYREIPELQIVQKDFEIFELNIVRGKAYTDESLQKVKNQFNDFMHGTMVFSVNFLDKIPLEKSGKARFCKCEIP